MSVAIVVSLCYGYGVERLAPVMQVEVTMIVSSPPRESDLDNLRSAAAELTHKRDSITVQAIAADGQCSLVTRFAMKTAAQYKVVDQISQQFASWTWDLDGYQEMIITFPH